MAVDKQQLCSKSKVTRVAMLDAGSLVTSKKLSAKRHRPHLLVLIGFAFGFAMAFTSLSLFDRKLFACDDLLRMTTASQSDDYSSGSSPYASSSSAMEESSNRHQWLVDEIRLVCMVLTCPKYHEARAAHIRATWGKRCSKLVFISTAEDPQHEDIVAVDSGDDYTQLWNKTRHGLQYLYDNFYEDYDWFMKADDDTYVIVDNLRYTLSAYYPETPLYFGHLLKLYNETYMSGGAGYVFSKEALRRYIQVAGSDDDEVCPPDYPVEDFALGRCMRSAGVHLVDSAAMAPPDNKAKFFPLEMVHFFNPVKGNLPKWLTNMTPRHIEQGPTCCSKYSIALHYVRPDYMYLYEFIIYQLRAFGVHTPDDRMPRKYTTKEIEKLIEASTDEE